jgi:hypothetical protein
MPRGGNDAAVADHGGTTSPFIKRSFWRGTAVLSVGNQHCRAANAICGDESAVFILQSYNASLQNKILIYCPIPLFKLVLANRAFIWHPVLETR